MFALLTQRAALRAATRPAVATRSIYVNVRSDVDPERVGSRLHGIMNEDGVIKSLSLKRFHEKGSQRRKRKVEEQTIRHVNRRVGSMIDFILRRKKAGF